MLKCQISLPGKMQEDKQVVKKISETITEK